HAGQTPGSLLFLARSPWAAGRYPPTAKAGIHCGLLAVLVAAKVFETRWRQLGVADCPLSWPRPETALDRSQELAPRCSHQSTFTRRRTAAIVCGNCAEIASMWR